MRRALAADTSACVAYGVAQFGAAHDEPDQGATMYTTKNFKTKKALKDAVAAGERVTLFAPGMGTPKSEGKEFVEGPHYPAPHTWYAEVTMANGVVTKVK